MPVSPGVRPGFLWVCDTVLIQVGFQLLRTHTVEHRVIRSPSVLRKFVDPPLSDPALQFSMLGFEESGFVGHSEIASSCEPPCVTTRTRARVPAERGGEGTWPLCRSRETFVFLQLNLARLSRVRRWLGTVSSDFEHPIQELLRRTRLDRHPRFGQLSRQCVRRRVASLLLSDSHNRHRSPLARSLPFSLYFHIWYFGGLWQPSRLLPHREISSNVVDRCVS